MKQISNDLKKGNNIALIVSLVIMLSLIVLYVLS